MRLSQALGAKAKGSPHLPPPSPRISSRMPSITSHLLVPANPGCCSQPRAATAQAWMLHAVLTAQYTSATPQPLCVCALSPRASPHSQPSPSNSPGPLP